MFESKLNILRKAYNYIDQRIRYRRISQKIKKETGHSPIRIVVGACGIFQAGWVPTDKEHLDIVDPRSWRKYFRKGTIDAILADHVWEHLTLEEGIKAAKFCYEYLKPNGYLRIAVPDGFFPDDRYIEYVKPMGSGSGAADHKILYNYRTLGSALEECGFRLNRLEYFDENGQFHYTPWSPDDGIVRRTRYYDQRNKDGQISFTSILIDAVKPEISGENPCS